MTQYILESPIVIGAFPLLEDDFGSRRRAYRSVEAVPHAPVHVPREELLERIVQRSVPLEATIALYTPRPSLPT